MEWLPTPSAAVLKLAAPLAFSEAVPSVVVPSRNATVPVGIVVAIAEVREPEGAFSGDTLCTTVAVRLRLAPTVIELALACKVVVVATSGAVVTVTVTAVEALEASLVSPL
jgi:hypothetical protein